MNTDFHSSFTVRFRRKFSIDLLERLPPHLSCVALLLHYLAKSENPIQKQSIPVLIIFFIPPSLWQPNSLDLNPIDYTVWILQECVY